MKSQLLRRLQKVEQSLSPVEMVLVTPLDWSSDTDEALEAKIARWRAGENFEGMRSDIIDREPVEILSIRIVDLDPATHTGPPW